MVPEVEKISALSELALPIVSVPETVASPPRVKVSAGFASKVVPTPKLPYAAAATVMLLLPVVSA